MVEKMPPQSKELEEAVLGACMLESSAVRTVMTILVPESFYFNAHKTVFRAIASLYNASKQIDILTVMEEVKTMGKLDEIGGINFIADLTRHIASAANIEQHSYILAQKYIQREIIRIGTQAVKDAYDDANDVLKLLDDLTVQLIKVTSQITKNNSKHIGQTATENYLKIEKMSREPGRLLGYSTGLKDLDKALHGIQPGVINIAARPSMGKSALMAQIVTHIAQQGVPCHVFTMEVSASKYEMRMKTQATGIHFERIQSGNIFSDEWEKLSEGTSAIQELPIWIDESATLSQVQLRSKCLQAYQEHGVRLFALDFIQLTDGGHENEGLTIMSRAVKVIAQELNVPFIILSQLSREVEKRPDKKPMLSDLRNSGSLEQDADVVMLLYRPEYYGLEAQDKNRNSVPSEGFAQIRIAKNKDGKVDTVDLRFKGENLLFSDYAQGNSYHPHFLNNSKQNQ